MSTYEITFKNETIFVTIQKLDDVDGVYVNSAFFPGWVSVGDFLAYARPVWSAIGLEISEITPACPVCNSPDVHKNIVHPDYQAQVMPWKCDNCGTYFDDGQSQA